MRSLLPIAAACVPLLAVVAAQAAAADVPRLIYDTDMGNDIDDAFALAMIHALQSRGECRLVAVVTSKDNEYAAPFCDLMNTWYARANVPVGAVRDGKTPEDSRYIHELCTVMDNGRPRYPHRLRSGRDAPEAVSLMRRVLARQPDHSVVFVATGFSTNLARLIDTPPDGASRLSGRDLVARKARLLSIMAGDYRRQGRLAEYNIANDRPAAARVFAAWPTPIVASGFEVGIAVDFPAADMARGFSYVPHHPVYEGSWIYQGGKVAGRPAWDCTSVLYAVRPNGGYFGLSPAGTVEVDAGSFTTFQAVAAGTRRYLTVTPEQITRARQAIVELTCQPPDRLHKGARSQR